MISIIEKIINDELKTDHLKLRKELNEYIALNLEEFSNEIEIYFTNLQYEDLDKAILLLFFIDEQYLIRDYSYFETIFTYTSKRLNEINTEYDGQVYNEFDFYYFSVPLILTKLYSYKDEVELINNSEILFEQSEIVGNIYLRFLTLLTLHNRTFINNEALVNSVRQLLFISKNLEELTNEKLQIFLILNLKKFNVQTLFKKEIIEVINSSWDEKIYNSHDIWLNLDEYSIALDEEEFGLILLEQEKINKNINNIISIENLLSVKDYNFSRIDEHKLQLYYQYNLLELKNYEKDSIYLEETIKTLILVHEILIKKSLLSPSENYKLIELQKILNHDILNKYKIENEE